jgi:hypothetical protein
MRPPRFVWLLTVLISAMALAQQNSAPLSFEANQGQTDARVKFVTRGKATAPLSGTASSQGLSFANALTYDSGGQAADFSQTNTCGNSVAGGASCFITVTFKPSATGTRSAAVSVSDNGGGSPQKVSVSGVGT